ncbi:MAG: hypothetical protein ISS93_02800 [Candidatus Aenigmarchaeota archaeon]|nr:hypothetical protein [Candidatus Aenigmarchaeota archaeon]
MDISDKLEWGPLATFVPNKKLPVYNWLYFKEGFSRELVFNLLDKFKPSRVLDPFCGSGTTLLACKEKGVPSVGTDQLPIARLASRVKTGDWDPEKLREVLAGLTKVKFRRIPYQGPFKRFFQKNVLEDVLLFKEEISKVAPPERDFLLLALTSTAMRISWAWKDGNVLKVKKHPVPPFRKFFMRRAKRMIKEAVAFQGTGKTEVAESLKSVGGKTVDAVITSPPYLNQIDYSRVYSIEDWLIDESSEGQQYLGPESEGKYFHDMGSVLKELFRVCKSGAWVGIVVGNAYFPQEDRIVESDLKLAELGEKADFKAKEILVLNKRHALQRRTIKRGELRESLIILKKE